MKRQSRITTRYIVALLLLFAALAAGCAPQVSAVAVEVTVLTRVQVVEVTATPVPVSPIPTSTPAPPTSTPFPTSTPTPPPTSALLGPMNYQPQTYNNCGPCSIAILLGYYDHWITQFEVNEHVAPGPSPCQIANYMSLYDLEARAYRIRYPTDAVRHLLANDIPVVAGQLLSLEDPIGHYRVIKGYDDEAQEFITDDPLQRMGPDHRIPYDIFDRISHSFVAVYPPERDLLVRSLMQDFMSSEIPYCRR
ncbi:MAG: hypothetical protein GY832_39515 [Chloroflexi bacterium]|nr:hypothetical protein [Chloroflexota bacterium]